MRALTQGLKPRPTNYSLLPIPYSLFPIPYSLSVSVAFWPPCLGAAEDSSSTCDGQLAVGGLGWMMALKLVKVLLDDGDTGRQKRSGGLWS